MRVAKGISKVGQNENTYGKCWNGFRDPEANRKEKQEKIASRKLLAETLGIKMETLHMRVHRLRESLKKCMKRGRNSELR